MRNLKKVLCLSLALVMLLGMMVVGAGAQGALDVYTDKDSINENYAEAVDLLTAIGVLEGDTGFRPGDTLTREQAAKLVAYIALGRDAAESLYVTTAPFADVAATRWSAGYIAYCANVGIINGWNGKFDPTSPVTGYQFAKMLLCVLGYGQKDEYVGGNWALNVSKDGVTTGLFSRMSYVGDTALTREQAAQLAYNALTMNMVAYSTLYGTYTFYTYDYGTQTLLGTKANKVFKVTTGDYEDGYGFNYEYWYKLGKNEPITDYYLTDTIMGTETKASLTGGALYKAYAWNAIADGGFEVIVNGTPEMTGVDALASYKGSTAKPFEKYNGYTAYIVDEDNAEDDYDADKIIVVLEYLAKVEKVTAATASADRKITLKIYEPTGALDDSANYVTVESDEFVKGDMLLIVPSANKSTGFADPLELKKAEVKTAAVTAFYKQTKNDTIDGSVTFGGKKYSYNWIFGKNYAALGSTMAEDVYDLSDATYKFYLDSNGNVIGAELVEATIGDYAYIIDVGEDAFEDYNSVKVVLSNGETGTYTISNKSSKSAHDAGGEKADASKVATAGEVYAYTINAKGEIVLTDLADNGSDAYSEFEGYTAVKDGYVKGESTFIYKDGDGKSGIAYATDETVFIYITSKGAVKGYYVGKDNAPDIEKDASAAFAIKTKNSVPYIEVVYIVDNPATAITTSYLYVTSDVVGYSTNVKGEAVNFYDVIIAGEKVRIATADSLSKATLYYYAVDEDAFLPEDPNTVEGGQYFTDTFTGKVETSFTVDKLVNGVMVDNDNPSAGKNTDILLGTANVTDVDGAVSTGATVNAKDVITVVYKEVSGVKVAQDIYITSDK